MFGYTPVEKDKKISACCDINLTNIFVLNHTKAKQAAEKIAVSLNPLIANTALAKDEKTLEAAGEQIVSIFVDNVDGAKEKAYAALRAYANQFGGPEAEKSLTDDKILSFNDQISEKSESNDENSDKKSEDSSDSEKLNESYFSQSDFNGKIFDEANEYVDDGDEEEEIDDANSSDESNDESVDSEEKPDDQNNDEQSEEQQAKTDEDAKKNDKKTEESKKPEKIGFYFVYSLKGVGIKETPIKDALETVSKNILKPVFKSVFGYLGHAIGSLEIKFGDGKTISLADVGNDIKKDFKKVGKGFGIIAKLFKSDPKKVITQFKQIIKQKLPTQTKCQVELVSSKKLFENKEVIERVDGVGRKKLLEAKNILVVIITGPERKSVTVKTIKNAFARSVNIGLSKLKVWFSKNIIEANPLSTPTNHSSSSNELENQHRSEFKSKKLDNSEEDILNETWLNLTNIDLCQIDDRPCFDIERHLFESLFEADKPKSDKSEKIIITFKYPVDPENPDGDEKKFSKNIVAKVGDQMKEHRNEIPIDIARSKFKSKGYSFSRWVPKIDYTSPLKHEMTYTALYKKTEDSNVEDNNDRKTSKFGIDDGYNQKKYLDDTDIYLIIISGKIKDEKSNNANED